MEFGTFQFSNELRENMLHLENLIYLKNHLVFILIKDTWKMY